MLKTILFDLDGTLLPNELYSFAKKYYVLITQRLIDEGFEGEKAVGAMLKGIEKIKENDGTRTNKEIFFEALAQSLGDGVYEKERSLEDFYIKEFRELKNICGTNPEADRLIKKLKGMGYRLVLATNPVFPPIAASERASWNNVDINDFEYLTHYENSHYSKPDVRYYKELLSKLGISENEKDTVLMVGNDPRDDGAARQLGIDVFLITDTPVIRENMPISDYNNGSFADLEKYILKNKSAEM